MMRSLYTFFALAALLCGQALATDWIIPGANWTDTNGKRIQAHGGGILREPDGTFYWIGEDKTGNTGEHILRLKEGTS